MPPFVGNTIVITTAVILGSLFFTKKFRLSKNWQATVTPLASIIGSGFLVSAPLIVLTSGKWAVAVMALIVFLAYLLGSAVRYNIQHLEPQLENGSASKIVLALESISHPTLGGAYVISVAFYLKLLSVFLMRGFEYPSLVIENSITTTILVFIGLVGWFRGLHMLEVLEKYAVSLKLAIIGALIICFYAFNIYEFEHDQWSLVVHEDFTLRQSFTKLLGTLIIVQGFETSRYMGDLYSRSRRITTMKYAQLISAFAYVTFVASAMILFNDVSDISETVVVDLCKIVAPVLPVFLIVAAVMSQFSAAVADSIGSSGLLSEATRRYISVKQGVVITILVAIALVWLTDVFGIIVIASKAFACYYGLQCLAALRVALARQDWGKLILFSALCLLMVMVIILSVPLE